MSSELQADVLPPFRKWPEGAEIEAFKGRCHCGKITFEFDHPALEVREPVSCNCSLCSRTGGLYIYGPENGVRLTGDEPAWFPHKTKSTRHHFCPACGNILYWTGLGRTGVNVRMFEGVEVNKLRIELFDGARILK